MSHSLPVLNNAVESPYTPAEAVLAVRDLEVRTPRRTLLAGVHFEVPPGQIFGVIGPSGAGKSTLLRCLNRLVDLIPGLSVSGEVRFEGSSIYRPEVDPDALRARIGILFQQPVIFPGSILHNVLFGARRLRRRSRKAWREWGEEVLRQVGLWAEVADRLEDAAASLSVGQQQRLCLARALATEPSMLLMDEPTSALDPRSTEAIESLVLGLRGSTTVILVSHDMEQVRRVADFVACVAIRDGRGEVLESNCCQTLLDAPQHEEVIRFLERSS